MKLKRQGVVQWNVHRLGQFENRHDAGIKTVFLSHWMGHWAFQLTVDFLIMFFPILHLAIQTNNRRTAPRDGNLQHTIFIHVNTFSACNVIHPDRLSLVQLVVVAVSIPGNASYGITSIRHQSLYLRFVLARARQLEIVRLHRPFEGSSVVVVGGVVSVQIDEEKAG